MGIPELSSYSCIPSIFVRPTGVMLLLAHELSAAVARSNAAQSDSRLFEGFMLLLVHE
jgi:hypothetical protein